MQMIDHKLGSNPFLHGEELGNLDLSLYGMTFEFARQPKMQCIRDMEDISPKFKEWLARMTPLVGHKMNWDFDSL